MATKPNSKDRTSKAQHRHGETAAGRRKTPTARDTLADAIGRDVRAERTAGGLSRKRLAALADVSERYLNDLENGSANASLGILSRVTAALDLDLATFLRRTLSSLGTQELPEGRIPAQALDPGLQGLLASMSRAEQQGAVTLLASYVENRRRTSRGLALLGLRGAGKTTLGRLFAERHGLPFVSITREIETRAGMSLADLFNLGGPDAYRAMEIEVARDLATRSDRIVLETAGGIVDNGEALDTILDAFKSVWLKASPEEHLARVARQGDMRPMQGIPRALDHLQTLLREREPNYARARFTLDTTGRPIEACLGDLEDIAAPLLA